MKVWVCWTADEVIVADKKPHYDSTDGRVRYVGHPLFVLRLDERLNGSVRLLLEKLDIKHDGRSHAMELRRWPT